jgi:hypothetical protein
VALDGKSSDNPVFFTYTNSNNKREIKDIMTQETITLHASDNERDVLARTYGFDSDSVVMNDVASFMASSVGKYETNKAIYHSC